MNVLMIASEFPPHVLGGLGVHVDHLVDALLAKGCRITLLTRSGGAQAPKFEQRERLKVIRLEVSGERGRPPMERLVRENIQFLMAGLECVRTETFDLIHFHGWQLGIAAMSLQEQTGLPLVATCHATEEGRKRVTNKILIQDHWEGEVLRKADRVIAVSRFLAEEIREVYGIEREIAIVYNGYSQPPDSGRSATWNREHNRLLFVGRLEWQKGVDVLLHALAELRDVAFELKIVGSGSRMQELQSMADQLGLAERVEFLGQLEQSEIVPYHRTADALIVPSTYEPFGIVCLEGMIQRLPLIASRVGGIAEIVDERQAYLVEPGNAHRLADVIRHCLANPEAAAELADRAYHRARQVFNWETIAEQTIEVYRQMVQVTVTG